jgi:hypothetical protein
MSLSGIGTGVGTSGFLTGGTQLQQLAAGVRNQIGISGLAKDTVSLSGQGQFLGSLQALKASDPQKFKEVLTQAATQLEAAAQQEGNTPRGQALANLAKKFQDVAGGGDIAQLKPTTYTNRVQRAYGSHQADGVQELFNFLGQGVASSAGTDAHYVLKSVVSNLNKI